MRIRDTRHVIYILVKMTACRAVLFRTTFTFSTFFRIYCLRLILLSSSPDSCKIVCNRAISPHDTGEIETASI